MDNENNQNNQGIQNIPNIESDKTSVSSPSVQQQPIVTPQPQPSSQPSQPSPETAFIPNQKGSNKLLTVGLILLGIAVGIGALTVIVKTLKQNSESQKTNTNLYPTQSINRQLPSPTPNPTADWKGAATNYFTFKYPSEIDVRTEEGDVLVLSKWGPTQTDGTELFDGFSVSFEPKETTNTPEEYAKSLIDKSEKGGVSEITEGSEPVTVNGYEGVTYTEEGLGTFKHYILDADNSSVLIHISILVSDPGNLSFQKEVDQIISTFEFIPGV